MRHDIASRPVDDADQAPQAPEHGDIRITVHPIPSDEELAAIIGAVHWHRRRAQTIEPAESPTTSRWATAGRREAFERDTRSTEAM